ncbi:MAG: hypothetical protein FJZ47_06960 [Candidatus Tectomicrobia bacterium]|uniref:Rhodanese domain-containing protein n=1 Tax=Tectimicrobiota bacterium TaxID=2528274 RepID=A0A937VZN1_UNCTE|nr:hypothetical protein [Candidatus Tectomicrobia bacterium]
MVDRISPAALRGLLEGDTQFACIDIREAGEYNTSHIAGSSLLSRRHLELHLPLAVPHLETPLIICDDDGRRAPLAAATAESMGYRRVSILDGGINRWVSQDFPTEWGSNVPSKDFGERVEVVHHVPEFEATELHERIARGDKLLILDSRTPEEYQRFCIPGGRSVPGGELALRITDITKDLDPDTTIVVNCAGRTRSIIGARVLQRMGLHNVYGLKMAHQAGSWRAINSKPGQIGWPCRSPPPRALLRQRRMRRVWRKKMECTISTSPACRP